MGSLYITGKYCKKKNRVLKYMELKMIHECTYITKDYKRNKRMHMYQTTSLRYAKATFASSICMYNRHIVCYTVLSKLQSIETKGVYIRDLDRLFLVC